MKFENVLLLDPMDVAAVTVVPTRSLRAISQQAVRDPPLDFVVAPVVHEPLQALSGIAKVPILIEMNVATMAEAE